MPSVAEMMPPDESNDRLETSDDRDDRMGQLTRSSYLMVKGSVAEDLVTREELTEALQFAGIANEFYLLFLMINKFYSFSGFNPTGRTISRHWPLNTRSLTFHQFRQIAEIEPIPSEKSLISMFQKLDEKNLGYLTHEEFLLNMTTRGEKLPVELIENLIRNEMYNNDKKFYYQKYCQDVIETSKKLESLAIEKVQLQDEEFQHNSKTYKVKRKTASPAKTVTSSPQRSPAKSLTSCSSHKYDSDEVITPQVTTLAHSLQSRGCFYYEQDSIISHQFSLVVREASTHRIAVHSYKQVNSKACEWVDTFENQRPLKLLNLKQMLTTFSHHSSFRLVHVRRQLWWMFRCTCSMRTSGTWPGRGPGGSGRASWGRGDTLWCPPPPGRGCGGEGSSPGGGSLLWWRSKKQSTV